MKGLLLLLSLLSLAFALEPSTPGPQLDAELITPDALTVPNCQASGGATDAQVQFLVKNHWLVSMAVEYEYFSIPNDGWAKGPMRACSAAPNTPNPQCFATIPLSLGGAGNGTLGLALLRLRGIDVDNNQAPLSKTFSFSIEHFQPDGERQVSASILQLQEKLAGAKARGARGYKDILCPADPSGITFTEQRLMDAQRFLISCDLRQATAAANELSVALQKMNLTAPKTTSCADALAAAAAADNEISKAESAITSAEKNCDTKDAPALLKQAREQYSRITGLINSSLFSNAASAAQGARSLAANATASIRCPVQIKPSQAVLPRFTPLEPEQNRPQPDSTLLIAGAIALMALAAAIYFFKTAKK